MTQAKIDALSDAEFHKEYLKRLNRLRREITKIVKSNKKTPKEHHNAIVKFVKAPKSTTFMVNDINVTISPGDKRKGFKHILLRHYCEGCEGEITARDIYTIGNIIANGRELTDYELKDNSLMGYAQRKNDEEYKLLLKKRTKDELVITMFKNGD